MSRPGTDLFSVLATITVIVAGWSGGAAALRPAEAGQAPPPAPISAQRQFDALAGSGSAGIDPAEAEAITMAEQTELTGDITFSVPSGTFQGQLSVQLSTSIPDAQIRYTTNGTLPTASSTLYGSAVTLTGTTQLRAQAFVGDTAFGAIGTSLYVARSISATHDLPLVVMDAYGAGKPSRAWRDVAVMVMAPQADSTSLAQTPAVATRAGFHLRGQSSFQFPKAPYRLELRGNDDKDADYPLLNMPADADWVLRGPYPDKTLIRDAFAYSLGREMGLQAPRFALVELYLNLDSQPLAANDYQGVYLLVETIKRGGDRLDIQKLKKTDLTEPAVTGGYIMQVNLAAAEPPTLTCTGATATCWRDLEVMEPDELQPEQQRWITSYIQRFHDALHGTNPANPQTGYPAYIDVDSFINRIIHNELAREGDSYMRSTHFYKDRGGKLTAGPLWDYDLGYDAVPMTGFGMPGRPATSAVQGWQYQPMYTGMPGMGNPVDWFQRLMQDPTFLNQVKTRWQTLRRGAMSDAQLRARVNTLSAPLANAAKRNFQRWNILNTATISMFPTQTSQTWEQQLTIMQNFLTQRAAWLDSTSGWGGSTPPTGESTPPPAGTRSCTATYAVTSQWNTGFQGEVKVTAGTTAISGWTVTWTFGAGQAVNQSWNATVTSSGASVTARNVAHNGTLSPGASTTFGFTGTWTGSNPAPRVSCTAP